MKKLSLQIFAIAVLFLPLNLLAQEGTFKWSNGYNYYNADKSINMKFGGRLQYDVAFFSPDEDLEPAFGELKNGAEFRRVRFFNSGSIYDRVKYKLQLDFAGGAVVFKDVFIEIVKIPVVGNLRIGHFKDPFKLESLTSSKYITFIERSLPTGFTPDRNTGFMIHNNALDKKLFWQLGFFRNGDNSGNDKAANDGYNLTARVTALPIMNEEKKQYLHLGAAYTYRNPYSGEDDKGNSYGTYSLDFRPESHLAPKLLKTGTIDMVDNIGIFGVEAAFVSGPLTIQGEYMGSTVSSIVNNVDNIGISGFYGMVSYFLTGEHRKYKDGYEAFDRIKPNKNFGSGPGAWELALRYSNADFNDKNLAQGAMNDITFGVNWYLNPVTRIMLNYVYTNLLDSNSDSVGKASIIQARAQVDF